jgi:transcriptional regulator with XRE-family HTH domain
LQSRLIAVLRARLQNGELTERRLARLTGISQPHVHNVLKGVRVLSPEIADQILRRLRISLLDLLTKQELAAAFCSGCLNHGGYREIPVLEGWLGPALPLPRTPSRIERYPFPKFYLTPLEKPLVARLAADARMAGVLRENDLALLDRSPHSRARLDPDVLYVVNRDGEGVIRRLRLREHHLWLLTEDSSGGLGRCETIALAGRHLLDIVHAQVIWIGRRLPPG